MDSHLITSLDTSGPQIGADIGLLTDCSRPGR